MISRNKSSQEGWHTIYGMYVYVNDRGFVVRGVKRDHNGSPVPAGIYIPSEQHGVLVNVGGELTLDAFKSRARRGTVSLH